MSIDGVLRDAKVFIVTDLAQPVFLSIKMIVVCVVTSGFDLLMTSRPHFVAPREARRIIGKDHRQAHDDAIPPATRPMCCAIASPVSPPTSASASRRSHPCSATRHSITSRYVHSADAVLLAAADAVATVKLMASDQAQPQLREGSATRWISCAGRIHLFMGVFVPRSP